MFGKLYRESNFKPKEAQVSDFDKDTIVKVSKLLEGCVLDPCPWACRVSDCKNEASQFRAKVQALTRSAFEKQ
jgi:hypothetical protein